MHQCNDDAKMMQVWFLVYVMYVTEICKLNIKDEENLRVWFSPTS